MFKMFMKKKVDYLSLSYQDLRAHTLKTLNSMSDKHEHKQRLKEKLTSLFPKTLKEVHNEKILLEKLQHLYRRIDAMKRSGNG